MRRAFSGTLKTPDGLWSIFAGVPPCEEEQALRLFVADKLIEAGVTLETLMKAQSFDPAPLALLKANFNPARPRWPAGSGRDSGEWSSGASIDTAGVKEPLEVDANMNHTFDKPRHELDRLVTAPR